MPGELRLASSRTNRSTTRGLSAAGMPGPLSLTVRSAPPSWAVARMLTNPPGGVYLMALSTRLASAWAIRLRLPSMAALPGSSSSVMLRSSARGSYSSATSAATDDRSRALMAARVVPASVSAISSRALKVPINWSVSAMARSISPASAPWAVSRAADSSSRLRSRFSGVRRSCATESVTSRRPFISRSMRSNMRLRFSARVSNSSPEPDTGTRRVRSPAMISPLVRLMVSTRRSMLRLISAPPPSPSSRISPTVQGRVVVNMRSVR